MPMPELSGSGDVTITSETLEKLLGFFWEGGCNRTKN